MTKDNVVIGAKLTLDVEDKKVFISIEDEVHIIEGDVKSSKITFNVPRGVDYTALFTGKVELTLEDYPCYLIEESKVMDLVDSMLPKPEELNKQQIPLFNQTNSEESEVAKNRGKKASTFEESAYEAHRAVGTKYRPDTSISKKEQKKFHHARRAYEALKGYETMYPSEKKGEQPIVTVDKPVQQTAPATAQQSTKESTEQVKEDLPTKEEIALAKAYGVDAKDVKVQSKPDVKIAAVTTEEHKKVEPATDMGKGAESVREAKIDIGKEMDTGDAQSLEEQVLLEKEFDIGGGNELGTFGQVWNGYIIAYFHKEDRTYTISATKTHPINGFKYYLAFPTDRGAKYVRDLMLKHGDIHEQVKDSKIYQISEIFDEELKSTPCVIVQEGLTYLSGTAIEKIEVA